MSFQFKLESLLKYRRHQLEQCRQLMGEILRDQTGCEESLLAIDEEHETIYRNMRHQNVKGTIDVRKIASWRYDATRMEARKREIQAKQNRIEQQLVLCRQAVQQADAAVKALERLREKQQKEYELRESKKVDIELQESWASQHLHHNRT